MSVCRHLKWEADALVQLEMVMSWVRMLIVEWKKVDGLEGYLGNKIDVISWLIGNGRWMRGLCQNVKTLFWLEELVY